MSRSARQSGFTAVELLITLFVAAAFLIAAYQLFNVVIRDGGNARAESRAGNIAYDYMRRYASTTSNPCTPSTPLSNYGITVDGLADTAITIAITCPYSATPNLSKIETTITYNNPQQTAKFATYSYGEAGGASTEIMEGLVGWWPLNGDANTTVGTANGTVFGATPTVGQNGQPNNGYSFSGASQYMNFTESPVPAGSSDFSISVWYNRSRNNVTEEMLSQWTNATSGNAFFLGFSGVNVRFSDSWGSTATSNNTSGVTGQWRHMVAINNATGNNAYIYIDGVLVATKGSRLTYTGTGNLTFARQGEYGGGAEWFQGSLDDIRIYNRALTANEIQTLYANGAK